MHPAPSFTASTSGSTLTGGVDAGAANFNYAANATYAPQGALASALHGNVSGGFGGITETWTYNDDLEAMSILASSTAGTALNLNNITYANNGGVTGLQNALDAGRNGLRSAEPFAHGPDGCYFRHGLLGPELQRRRSGQSALDEP